MRILVTANLTPFLHGGADAHIRGLVAALGNHGHQVDLIRFPFQFEPLESIERLMDFASSLNLCSPNGQNIDRVISLQFPGYGIQHPEHIVWVMHQHRAVYELFNEGSAGRDLRLLKNKIENFDRTHLGSVRALYANSHRVAERLLQFNGLKSTPLYHPPENAHLFRCYASLPYIFCPSRLESLKRQDLLIEALVHCADGLPVFFAGDGGQRARYEQLVERYGLRERVHFLGKISEEEKISWYANSTAVFFGPFDEDYGYITLEAMLSSKPVITCMDSGGPLEFVNHMETGWVVQPNALALADCLSFISCNLGVVEEMGRAAREFILAQDITWENVVEQLLKS